MIPRGRLINKLEELGFRYVSSLSRNDLFKKIGSGIRYASIPRHDLLEDETVREVLRHAGCSQDEIGAFIQNQCH